MENGRANGRVNDNLRTGSELALLLASASPRRRSLLQQAGLEPIVSPVDLDETPVAGESPAAMVARLALAKARAARRRFDEGEVVLAADTTVVDRGNVLGKPSNINEAVDMLMGLRGRQHEVITALALIRRADGKEIVNATRTWVEMRSYTKEEAERYAAGGSPLDKAGGYGIQDQGFHPVDLDSMDGCFTNVMGLPLCTLEAALTELDVPVSVDLTAACLSYHPHKTPAEQVVP
ncbi:MAG: nucleoside triphosphate pyrophosphatase [Anaerolineales bacterium]